jgi:hypothetical protein
VKPKKTDSSKKHGTTVATAKRLAELEQQVADARRKELDVLADVVTGKVPWEILRLSPLPPEAAPDEPAELLAARAIQAVLDVARVNQRHRLDSTQTAPIEVAIAAIADLLGTGDGAGMKRARAAFLGGRGEEATEAQHREALAIVQRCLKHNDVDADACRQALALKVDALRKLTTAQVSEALSRPRAQPAGVLAELYLRAGIERRRPSETEVEARERVRRAIKRPK